MTKTLAQINRDVADDLIAAGQRRIEAEAARRGPDYPERKLQQQIEAAKRQASDGQDVGQRLLELRMRHRAITGADGG